MQCTHPATHSRTTAQSVGVPARGPAAPPPEVPLWQLPPHTPVVREGWVGWMGRRASESVGSAALKWALEWAKRRQRGGAGAAEEGSPSRSSTDPRQHPAQQHPPTHPQNVVDGGPPVRAAGQRQQRALQVDLQPRLAGAAGVEAVGCGARRSYQRNSTPRNIRCNRSTSLPALSQGTATPTPNYLPARCRPAPPS